MKVSAQIDCLIDISNSKTIERLNRYWSYDHNHRFDGLSKGDEFTVYGMIFRDNAPWYYIIDGFQMDYPSPYPSDLFNVVDPRLSRFWELATVVESKESAFVSTELVFKEWAEDQLFYERLVEGYAQEVEKFKQYRALMDSEFQ